MNLSLADQYYLKAMNNFPYALESVVENLQYALSYDDEHHQATCMMGQMQMYLLKDYEQAKQCFEKALYLQPHYTDAYKHLCLLLIWLGQYNKADQLILKALDCPGMDHCTMLRLMGMSQEYQGQFRMAKKIYKKAALIAVHFSCVHHIESDISRVKKKLDQSKRKKKIKSK